MGIRVNLNDAVVEVGGNFREALESVKSFRGRRYDPATKTWTVPVSLDVFVASVRMPLDVLSGRRAGSHFTAYGNEVAREEWEEMRREWRIQAEEEARKAPLEAEAREAFRQELFGLGLPEKAVNFVVQHWYRLDDYEELGKVRFSSPERRQAVWAAIDRHAKRLMEIDAVADEAINARLEREREF